MRRGPRRLGCEPCLLRTWHPATRPAAIGLDPAVRWLGLDVLDSTDGGPFGREGIVEFRARYTDGSVPGELQSEAASCATTTRGPASTAREPAGELTAGLPPGAACRDLARHRCRRGRLAC
ncbi:MAG: hypothetical protein ACRDRJ_48755 [Streptosporangiaceae bacterium]